MVPSPPLMGQGSLPTSRPTHSRVLFCCPTTSLHRRSPHDRLSQWVQELHGPQWGTAVGQEGGGGCGTHTCGAEGHVTPARPTLMGLGVMGPRLGPHLWGWGVCGTHTYGAEGHVTPSRPIVMGLGVMGARPDPHLWGWGSRDPGQTHSYGAMGSWDHFQTHTYGAGGHVTLSRPTLVGLGVT